MGPRANVVPTRAKSPPGPLPAPEVATVGSRVHLVTHVSRQCRGLGGIVPGA